jgi:hypothetical protein
MFFISTFLDPQRIRQWRSDDYVAGSQNIKKPFQYGIIIWSSLRYGQQCILDFIYTYRAGNVNVYTPVYFEERICFFHCQKYVRLQFEEMKDLDMVEEIGKIDTMSLSQLFEMLKG